MNKEYLPLESLTFYKNNPRLINKKAVNAVADSIKKFGFRQPIVVDQNNVIIAGHVRYHAATLLLLKEVWVERVENLSEHEIKEYRLIDNRTSDLTVFNEQKLAQEIETLNDVPGWTDDEINEIRSLLQKEVVTEYIQETDTVTSYSKYTDILFNVPRVYAFDLKRMGNELIEEFEESLENA